jgi:protein-tyrosine phosphatase
MHGSATSVQGASMFERFVKAMRSSGPAKGAKRRLRDLRSWLDGHGLVNPDLPPSVSAVLFVCFGNICRSPFAARLMADRRPAISCRSAGVRTTQTGLSPENACLAAASFGIALDDHRPTLLTRELIAVADLVVVMEAAHLSLLRTAYPEAASRVVLLSLFDPHAAGAYERLNIEDPFSQPLSAFEHCYRRIDRALDRLLSAIDQRRRPDEPHH